MLYVKQTCADPGIFVRGGGGGGAGQLCQRSFVLVLSSFYRSQMVNLKKKSIIFQGSRGGQTLLRGPNFFQGDPIAYYP